MNATEENIEIEELPQSFFQVSNNTNIVTSEDPDTEAAEMTNQELIEKENEMSKANLLKKNSTSCSI